MDRLAQSFRVQIARVELIRWRNQLAPYVDSLPVAGQPFALNRARLDALEALRDRGRRLLQRWHADGLAEDEQGEEAVESMLATLRDCDRLITRWIAVSAQQVLDRVAARELEPSAAPDVDDLITDQVAAVAAIAPDELEDVQHALDRITAERSLV